jgi:RNA polymerase sigma factor (sigma-70 family)
MDDRTISGPPEQPSDGSLLRQFKRGDGDAATLLYFRYAEQLLSLTSAQLGRDLSRRVDPEDVVQSVFRTFFRRAERGQFEVPQGEDVWRLFLVIALNKIRNLAAFHRAARRDVRRTQDSEAATENAPQAPDALDTLRLVIEELLTDLPPSNRQAIELRIEGHEVAEIAQRIGRSKRSVERILQEFRARLEGILNEDPTDDPHPSGDRPTH